MGTAVVNKRELRVVRSSINKRLYAKIGDTHCPLPITEDGRIVLPTGSMPVFRPTLRVEFLERETESGLEFVPTVTSFGDLPSLIKDKAKRYSFSLNRVLALEKRDKALAEIALETLMNRILIELYTPEAEWEPKTSFEIEAQKRTVVLDKTSELPFIPGRFFQDVQTHQRIVFMEHLAEEGISSLSATQPGNPGTSADIIDEFGYPIHVGIQPLARMLPKKRWKISRGLTHLLPITGAEEPLVKVDGHDIYPEMANMLCVGISWESADGPVGRLNDAIVISRSAAERLTVVHEDVHKHSIDALINCRGGLSYSGRKGALTQEWVEVTLGSGKVMRYPATVALQRKDALNPTTVTSKIDKAAAARIELHRQWRESQGSLSKAGRTKRAAWVTRVVNKEGISREEAEARYDCWHGDYSAKGFAAFEKYQAQNLALKAEKEKRTRPIIKRYESAGVERIDIPRLTGSQVIYREVADVELIAPSDGMKLQSEADAFKGVAFIMEDKYMPRVRFADKTTKAVDVVFDITSAVKHGSLRQVCLTMALNTIAKSIGGMTVNHEHPIATEDIVKVAQESGYLDESLTLELMEPDSWLKEVDVTTASGTKYTTKPGKSLGYFATGYLRVGRHRQHPDVVGGVVGEKGERVYEKNRMKVSGKRMGYVETMIEISEGLIETAKELRPVPVAAEAELESLRAMMVYKEEK